MEFDNKLLLIISIASLIFTNSFRGFQFSPSSSQENEIADELKETFGPIFDEAKEALSPDSSLDLDKVEEAFSPSLDEAKDAFGPISSWDEAKEAFGPVSSSIVDDAKKALSPSTIDEAKEKFGPASSKVIDKAKKELDSIASWISQNKQDISFEAQNELGLIPSRGSLISQKKEEVSSDSPYISVDSPKGPGPHSSFDENAPSPSQSPTPAPPTSPSTLDEAKHVIGSYSSKAIDAAKEQFGSISSLFSQNKVELITSKSDIHHPHSLAIYFDQDTSLAIESLIMKGQSNSHLAIEETKKLLSGITITSSESGKCMQKCIKNYESCIQKLTKAMEDLNGRNADLLVDDVSAVDGEISACQKCYLDNRETQSPLKDLEDAIIKATHDCLNVLDHSD